jgi:2-polyprenyl-3-methyl-5-hydroxy-6-metoxy-1,4-benzoquinol methylase
MSTGDAPPGPARQARARELCHEKLGDRFAEARSNYDTRRRVEVLIDRFLTPRLALPGLSVLDVGCGLGDFSVRLSELGARVVACDIGRNLVRRTRQLAGCDGVVADALALGATFDAESFDLVVSSECIEHTPSPARAIEEMAAVLKPGGYISLSTPNLVWKPLVLLATAAGTRPFEGYENFSTWRGLRRALRSARLTPVEEFGLHLFPFQLGAHALSKSCDERFQRFRALMINICILARKDSAH